MVVPSLWINILLFTGRSWACNGAVSAGNVGVMARSPASAPPPSAPAEGGASAPVEVRRSARRRRTVSAYRDGGRTIVLIPARMSRAEERHWVAVMVQRLEQRERRVRPSDEVLLERARALSTRFLGGRAEPASVRWVTNQSGRWGSCTVDDRSIRISTRAQGMPAYVVDYVLLHELAHLLVPGHGPDFWAALADYPRLERARGFLDGWTAGLAAPADEPGAQPADEPGAQPADEPGAQPADEPGAQPAAEPASADE